MTSRAPMRTVQSQNSNGFDRREATKRHIMGVWKENNNDITSTMSSSHMSTASSTNNNQNTNRDNDSSAIDGSNSTHVQLLVQDLETKFQQHLELLKADLFTRKKEQHQAYMTGIMKLPKSIQQMSVREFNSMHNCNLLQLLKRHDGCVVSSRSSEQSQGSANPMMMTIVKKRDRLATYGMQTPAPSKKHFGHGVAPGSVVRTVRRGEILYSQNGSPVGTNDNADYDEGSLVLTVTKKRRGNNSSNHHSFRSNSRHNDSAASPGDATNFEINVGDGKFISLNDPQGVKQLDSSMKATAASQLKVIQDQMASLMAQLTSG